MMQPEIIKKISIPLDASIITALRQMDNEKRKLLIVLDNNKYKSLLSIGDIQRAIIANVSLQEPVKNILREQVKVASVSDDLDIIKQSMRQRRNEFMPIVDNDSNVVDVIFWEDLFSRESSLVTEKFNVPIVIMAGGKGERLRPLTNVLPKPLIPIGEHTMIEDIIDKFIAYGCDDFYLSLNYKADLIKQYISSFSNLSCRINYFQETKPSGTAGSLSLLKGVIDKTFFVSNCDTIIDANYSDILKYHLDNKNEITIVSAIQNISVPYGTLETGGDGLLMNIKEKPDFTVKINTGMYVLEPTLLNEIPENEFYHITTLIDKLVKSGRRVGVFPINSGSWLDVGNWKEYIKCIEVNR